MISGSQFSLAELLSLRKFSRVHARTEPPAFILRWSENGDTVYCGDEFKLKIEDFKTRRVFHQSSREADCTAHARHEVGR